MLFSDIPGQEALKRHLRKTARSGRVSHAQLLYGSMGYGLLPLALAYAQYVSCEHPGEDDACGNCPSCNKIAKLIHPDLHFVFPVVKSSDRKSVSDSFLPEWRQKVIENPYFSVVEWFDTIGSGKSQGMIYSEESQEIIRKLSLKTYEGEFKIMIVWMAERMNAVGANKLLKMIEEPPSKTLFLLLVENPGEILPTIYSRCQPLRVPPIEDDVMVPVLQQTFSIDANRAADVSALAGGDLVLARQLMSENRTGMLEEFKTLMRVCYSKKIPEIIDWAEKISRADKEVQKETLAFALQMIRESFALTCQVSDTVKSTNDERAFMSKFHPFIKYENVFAVSEELEKAIYHLERNGNTSLIFVDMALSIAKMLK